MSWLYSQALVEEFSEANYLGGELCARLKKTRIARRRYLDGKKKGPLPRFRSGVTWKRLTVALGVARWISSLVDFPVKTSRLPVVVAGSLERDLGFGGKWQELSAKYDRRTRGWKTHLLLLREDLPWSSVTLPRWGMMRDGVLYRRKTQARPIAATGSGYLPTPVFSRGFSNKGGGSGRVGKVRLSLDGMASKGKWPTPRATDAGRGGRGDLLAVVRTGECSRRKRWPTPKASVSGPDYARVNRPSSGGDDLATAVARYPTPTASDHTRGCEGPEAKIARGRNPGVTLNDAINVSGGQLNPNWVEWLMGWPMGWTSMDDLSADELTRWRAHMNRGSWWGYEPRGVPRAVKGGVNNRVDRLKAIGNGQVPLSMVFAWLILTGINEEK